MDCLRHGGLNGLVEPKGFDATWLADCIDTIGGGGTSLAIKGVALFAGVFSRFGFGVAKETFFPIRLAEAL